MNTGSEPDKSGNKVMSELEEFLDDQDEWHNESFHRATFAAGKPLHLPSQAELDEFHKPQRDEAARKTATNAAIDAGYDKLFTPEFVASLTDYGFVRKDRKYMYDCAWKGWIEVQAGVQPNTMTLVYVIRSFIAIDNKVRKSVKIDAAEALNRIRDKQQAICATREPTFLN